MALRAVEGVDVEVQRSRLQYQPLDAALLDCFPAGRRRQVRVTALAVPAHLEPAPDLGVEREERLPAVGVDDQHAAGQVPGRARTPHRVVVGGQVVDDLPAQVVLGRIGRAPGPEQRGRLGVEGLGHGGAAYGRGTVRRVAQHTQEDIDPARFVTRFASPRGFLQAYVHEGVGGVPLVCVHGWPETKRIFWRVIEPLAAAGFEVIVPDLRGFGESELGPDGFHDVPSHSHDLHALVREQLGHEKVVLVGGDLGGPVVQDLALRHPDWVERMVLFNSPLPYDKERMVGLRSRPAREASDYFVRQGTDPDGLAAELDTPERRRRYIATFYTSRFWAHPGAFLEEGEPPGRFGGSRVVDFHTEPFASAASLRASFGGYESVFDPEARSEPPLLARNERTPTMILFGPSDHVLYPDFDLMAAAVFEHHVGPFLLRDCGHFVPWEAPHALVSGLRMMASDLLAARRSEPLSRS